MKAVFSVIAGGEDISSALSPVLLSLSVSDKAGRSSDSATIELDDKDGQLILPPKRSPIIIMLGWEEQGVGIVFEGIVDDIKASGSRSGRTVTISAKGMDTRGKAKQKQRRHFDDTTVGDAMQEAGSTAGFSVSIDKELSSIKRKYISMDGESFVAFGERMASEVGGTFKVVGKKAILAKRNGGTAASGAALPTVSAVWGQNLHSYDITPITGRLVEKKTRSRWYDKAKAKWNSEEADTGTEESETTKDATYPEADQDLAVSKSKSDAAESDRKSGEGSVEIEGNIGAQPEGLCVVSGCRPGVDGTYRIDGVNHDYSRSGFVTRLDLQQPKGTAGKDTRGGSTTSSTGRTTLAPDPELG